MSVDAVDDAVPTVFVVDDDPGVRKSLRLLLETVNLPTETFASAQEFLDACDLERPGCLVLDLAMPGMSGLELQERLRARHCIIPIIFITAHGEVSTAVRAMKDGAKNFLEKPFCGQALIDMIQREIEVNRQERLQLARIREACARLGRLTRRERQVLDLLVQGLPIKAIADELAMAKKTCDVHRSHIIQKTEVNSVPELVQLYILGSQAEDREPPAGLSEDFPGLPSVQG